MKKIILFISCFTISYLQLNCTLLAQDVSSTETLIENYKQSIVWGEKYISFIEDVIEINDECIIKYKKKLLLIENSDFKSKFLPVIDSTKVEIEYLMTENQYWLEDLDFVKKLYEGKKKELIRLKKELELLKN